MKNKRSNSFFYCFFYIPLITYYIFLYIFIYYIYFLDIIRVKGAYIYIYIFEAMTSVIHVKLS